MNEKFLENKKEYTDDEIKKMKREIIKKTFPAREGEDKEVKNEIWLVAKKAINEGREEEVVKIYNLLQDIGELEIKEEDAGEVIEKITAIGLSLGFKYDENGKLIPDDEQIGKNIDINT